MARIFISYRRADSAMAAGRIYDRLVDIFGEENIFKDVDDIPPGMDFRGVIIQEVEQSDVMLVIIGSQWTNMRQRRKRRLFQPNDFIRVEVEAGLNRPGCRVIPVLLGDTPMPSRSDLPHTMHDLVFRNAISVRNDPDFNRDIDRLIWWLQGNDIDLAPLPRPNGGVYEGSSPVPRRVLWPYWGLGLVMLVLIAAGAFLLLNGGRGGDHSADDGNMMDGSLAPAAIASMVGALNQTQTAQAWPDTPLPTATANPAMVAVSGAATATPWPFAPAPSATCKPSATPDLASPSGQRTAMPTLTAVSAATMAKTPTTVVVRPQVIALDHGANVRSGDSTAYPISAYLEPGETAFIIGISPYTSSWVYIRMPNGMRGWVSLSVVLAIGDFSNLPVITTHAMPTPTAHALDLTTTFPAGRLSMIEDCA